MKSSIVGILILIALCTTAFYAGRRTAPLPQEIVLRDTAPGDSIPYAVPVKVPTPYLVHHIDTVTVLLPADTAAILAAYFAKAYYSDTLKNDTSAFIALKETVTQNRIVERILMFQNRRPTAITTTTVLPPAQEPKLQLYGGVLVGKDIAAPMVSVGWQRWQVGAGYNLQKGGVVVSVGWRWR
jgi:hypothetical protein